MDHQQFSEADWEILLSYIQERSVIPVIGEGLSMVSTSGSPEMITFQKWLCNELVERLNLQPCDTLTELLGQYSASGQNLKSLYPLIRNLVVQSPFDPPAELKMLAEISDFPLFVTTTFDNMLAKALREINGMPPIELAYSPKRFDDLPDVVSGLKEPHLYYLFGQSAAIARYAISEEDVLEWISNLQSDTHSPERLLSELQNHHLLVIGVNYPDWLGRFFVRTAKRRRLSEDREYFEFIVHPLASSDASLASFLRATSANTYLITDYHGPSDFVHELHKRWSSSTLGSAQPDRDLPDRHLPVRFLPPAREMPEGSIFISYSRSDLEAVKRLKGGMDDHGLPVWFDLDRIETGDNYYQKIETNINNCSYFMPVISSEALQRSEAFFYKEWSWALERRRGMKSGAIFILPIIIDDTPFRHPGLAEITHNCDVAQLPEGIPNEALIQRLKLLLRPTNA